MNIGQAFRLSIKSIISNKMRSFLTMLGMIIGVASVITLIGLMQGVTDYILQQFNDLGTSSISVSVTNTGTRNIDVDDMYSIVSDHPELFQAVSPLLTSSVTIKNGNKSVVSTVYGVGEDYLNIKSYHLISGRFIQYSDIATRYNGCVIGTYISEELFDGKAQIGDEIKINGQVYTIVGIQEEQSNSEENSADHCIYIPYSNGARMMGMANINSFTFLATEAELVEQGEDILDQYLYGVMKNQDLYVISSLTELLDMVDTMMGTMSAVLAGIAGISLLVAGIGIMNIMLVSVVERTKEIGIRKSLGAKKRDIMRQFVIEAGMISTLGGLVGILIGSVGTIQLGNLLSVNAAPTMGSVLLSFGVSAGIGIGFGYMPASKAAKLNPIDALRNE